MDFSSLSVVFRIVLVVLIFIIILYALKIISKDLKRGKAGKNLGWKLRIEYSGDRSSFEEGEIVPIGSKLTIGRNKNNQMVLPSRAVSNFHAKIYFEDGRYMLEDLDSTNGTYVNDNRVDKKSLQPGDEIRISETVLTVTDDD
ncbi:FHA domain-containing protein [Ruminiclostridium josui]|uniref:FHA domain-containing protein n=1 Tax=Ruminiclostridium josui TaxID=1499 RepID=UPI000467BF83|nr:FHA domain-containing protein [Ruminiclostridium josui]